MKRYPQFSFRSLLLLSALVLPLSSGMSAKVTLEPDADTYIRGGGDGEKNFGSNATMEVRNTSNKGYNRVAYVRFVVGGEKIKGSEVIGAELTLRLGSVYRGRENASTVHVYGLSPSFRPQRGQLGLDWKESELTNTNAPWAATATNQVPSYVRFLGAFETPGKARGSTGQEFPISGEALVDFVNECRKSGQNLATFIIVEQGDSPNSITFLTKENVSFTGSTLQLKF